MRLDDCRINDFVKIKINGRMTNARVIQKGRKGNIKGEFMSGIVGYGSKRFDIRVKIVGGKTKFLNRNTIVEKEKEC